MRQNQRPLLIVEPLEARWVPAAVRLLSSSLLISNPLVVNGQAGVTLKATANNTFSVYDTEGGTAAAPGVFEGSYTVGGNIFLSGSNAPDKLKVDLYGFSYTGNLFVNSGNGNDSTNITSGVAAKAGVPTLAGNINVLGTYGNDTVALNWLGNSSVGLRMGGSIQVGNTTGNSVFQLGNDSTATTVGGNVTVTNSSKVQIGRSAGDTIGGSLNVLGPLNATGLNVTLGNASTGLTVLGDFNLTGGSGSGTLTVINPSTFGGDVNVNLPEGGGNAALVDFSKGSTATATTISGNLNVQTGDASTTIRTGGGGAALLVEGNAGFQFGNGNDLFLPGGGASVADDITIQGNLSLTAGNGNDTTFVGPGPASTVNGNVYVNLGNGTDVTIVGAQVGGTFNYQSGNGNDVLQVGNGFVHYSYDSHVQFGNGNDLLELGSNGLYGGTYDGGGRLPGGANTFVIQNNGVLTSSFELSNFP